MSRWAVVQPEEIRSVKAFCYEVPEKRCELNRYLCCPDLVPLHLEAVDLLGAYIASEQWRAVGSKAKPVPRRSRG